MATRTSQRSYRSVLYGFLVATQALLIRRRPRPGVLFQYPPLQSPLEERFNGLIHVAAGLASLFGSVWLINASMLQPNALMTLGCAACTISMTTVFAMSALSHLLATPRLQQMFRALDQASIYLFAAGSCTPYFIRYLIPHGWGWLLPLMWGVALLGAWDKVRGHRVNSVSIPYYVLLGSFPLLAAKPLLTHMPTGCVMIVVFVSTCYFVGLAFFCLDERYRFFHAVWHLFVVAAGAGTYAGVVLYVI